MPPTNATMTTTRTTITISIFFNGPLPFSAGGGGVRAFPQVPQKVAASKLAAPR